MWFILAIVGIWLSIIWLTSDSNPTPSSSNDDDLDTVRTLYMTDRFDDKFK